jgi:hypothetical protein
VAVRPVPYAKFLVVHVGEGLRDATTSRPPFSQGEVEMIKPAASFSSTSGGGILTVNDV